MVVERVELLVEEPSMEAALRLLLPGMLGQTSFEIYSYQCKDDLLQRLPECLRGYAKWLPPSWRIVVMVDLDDDDCAKLKRKLEGISADAGLTTRTRRPGGGWSIVNRIVIEELEAWYFGDWAAVRAAYPRVPASVPRQARFRDPDAIRGTWEAFEHILQNAGYFKGGLRKVEVARIIGAHMNPATNCSRSFQALRGVLSAMSPPEPG